MKAILTGFNPAPDIIIKEYDDLAAMVWGKIYRYQHMKAGVCKASQQRIANELGRSRDAVNKRIQWLVKEGYVIDITPAVKGTPHQYVTTNKVNIQLSAEAVVENDNKTPEPVVTDDTSPVVENDTNIEVNNIELNIDTYSALEHFVSIFGKFNKKEAAAGYPEQLERLVIDAGKEKFKELVIWAAGLEGKKRRSTVIKSMESASKNWDKNKHSSTNNTPGGFAE